MKNTNRWFSTLGLLALLALTQNALAATCTSLSAGRWDVTSRWSCGRIPQGSDTVVIAHNNVQMRNNYTVVGLTINAGAVLDDGGNSLTVNGSVVNNGTFGISGSGGDLIMQTSGATLSGSGTFADSRLMVDSTNITLSAGSTMNFTLGGNIRVGSNGASSFTIAGTITDTGISAGNRIVRVDKSSTLTISGSINTPSSYIELKNTTDKLNNNGSVICTYLKGKGVWTQGGSSSVTMTQQSTGWTGTINASATGNTFTYNTPAIPLTPSSNTYYNLAGSGVTCPHSFTILGTHPCVATPGTVTVTKSPGSCANSAGIGSVAWSIASNALTSNNSYADASINGTTNYLKCTGYGFAIPTTATILGVAVNVERHSSSTSKSTDGAMRLVKAGTIGSIDRSTTTTYTTGDVSQTHGGSTDLWGVVWTPADINNTNFGAAFAAKTTKTRTISVDHMPITVTYSAPAAAPHHIQIEHSGGAKTCAPELLTVRACADAACATNFTTANVTGNVTWSGSPGGSLPFTIASGSSGQVTVSLAVTSAQTVTLGTSSISPSPTASSGCTNGAGGTSCSLPFAASSLCLDAVEVGQAVSTPIYLKLAGTSFQLDVKTYTGSNYTGTVQVELVDASSGSCSSYGSLNSQNVTFSSNNKKTVSFNYANAARIARVRMTAGAASSCSSDGFVIRPTEFVIDAASANADATGSSATATPVIKAGNSFTLTASAAAGYDGTPIIDNALISAHSGAVASGQLSGSFTAANAATGDTSGSFGYDEVGYFRLNANAVNDQTFANLDALESTPECTLDYSNGLVGGKYGCYIGHAATEYFGRFIPDHFETIVSQGCDNEAAGIASFTYSGQTFALELSARSTAGTPTQNYDSTFAKPVILSDALNASSLGTFNPSTIAASSFVQGAAPMDVSYSYAASKTAPTLIGARAVEATGNDGVTSQNFGEGETEIRSGRVKVDNAYGSELLNLSVPVTAQYWNGSAYVANTLDQVATCTSFAPPTITLTNGTAITATWPNVDPDVTSNVGFLNGDAGLVLAAPSVTGYADITVPVPSWLQYAWSSTTKTNPTARATFGVYAGKKVFIYRGRRGR